MKRLLVDFNEVYDDECIWTSLRQMPVVVVPLLGETVELYDRDGERCWAVVERVDGPIVHARMKWNTYQSAPPRLPAPPGPEVPDGVIASQNVVLAAHA